MEAWSHEVVNACPSPFPIAESERRDGHLHSWLRDPNADRERPAVQPADDGVEA